AVADAGKVVVALEGGVTDTARAVLPGLAVTGLGADAPVTELALATEYEALDLLGLLTGLEFTGDFRVAELPGQLRIGKLGNQPLADFIVLEAAVQGTQPDFAVVVRAIIQVETEPGTFPGDVVATLLELLQPGLIIEVPGAAGLDVIRTELPLLPAEGGGDTEVVHPLADAEAVAEGAGQLGAVLAGVLVVAALGAETVEQTVVVEGRQAFHLDGAAEGVGIHIRGQGLDHGQRLHQFAGQHVHGYRAAVILRRGHQGAVDGHAVEIRAETAHPHEAAFTLVALDRQAGNALQCLGGIVIRQLADGVGMHHAL